ncbi:hypothetical protein B0A72_07375 [Flavobacterium pectinovorum]|uniref:Uncharacterized protein n=1 Tax=Flavobacterium pectinovorum TaxID=29533 RepID=A0AB36P3B2_9FLAO|nr:hypothetical protein RT99_17810 [Flavobacterium sp. MEB061]OXB05822.1 hypothetical protein B0A72_07375 [Flavobacterium pectinovorum]
MQIFFDNFSKDCVVLMFGFGDSKSIKKMLQISRISVKMSFNVCFFIRKIPIQINELGFYVNKLRI